MSVILKVLIGTVCLLICIVSSEAHTIFTDKSISAADMHRQFIKPSITTNRHKRKAILDEGQQNIIQASSNLGTQEINRKKRVVVFRPLFVYRQQQIEKTRLRNDGSQEHQAHQAHHPTDQQPTHKSSDSGTPEVHHHHHHHHHHHYPEGVQRTYD